MNHIMMLDNLRELCKATWQYKVESEDWKGAWREDQDFSWPFLGQNSLSIESQKFQETEDLWLHTDNINIKTEWAPMILAWFLFLLLQQF